MRGKDSEKFIQFEDESEIIELEDVELSYAFGEARPRVMAPSQLATFTSLVETGGTAVEPKKDVLLEILDVVTKFENLPVSGVMKSLGTLTTNPYLSVSDGAVETIDEQAMTNWLESGVFAAIKDTYEGDKKHKVSVVDISMSLIDDKTASVQYHIEDKLPSGRVLTGTSAVILVKRRGKGWQIAVHCQHPLAQ